MVNQPIGNHSPLVLSWYVYPSFSLFIHCQVSTRLHLDISNFKAETLLSLLLKHGYLSSGFKQVLKSPARIILCKLSQYVIIVLCNLS